MDVLYRAGPSSAGEVCAQLPDPPTPTAMRTLLRILEEKGHLRHERIGTRHVYSPVVPRAAAQRSAMRHVVATFFGGTVKDAVATLIDVTDAELTPGERRELIALIRDARDRGE